MAHGDRVGQIGQLLGQGQVVLGVEHIEMLRGRRQPLGCRAVDGDLQQTTTDVLQRLVRFNTVNPPGNEGPAIEYLASYLREAGFEVEILGPHPDRPSLVADLRGEGHGPTLCYLGHVDTVLATPAEWEHDPWSGDVADGFLWGRGALDMKSQVAAEAVAVPRQVSNPASITGTRSTRGQRMARKCENAGKMPRMRGTVVRPAYRPQ